MPLDTEVPESDISPNIPVPHAVFTDKSDNEDGVNIYIYDCFWNAEANTMFLDKSFPEIR